MNLCLKKENLLHIMLLEKGENHHERYPKPNQRNQRIQR